MLRCHGSSFNENIWTCLDWWNGWNAFRALGVNGMKLGDLLRSETLTFNLQMTTMF